MGMLEAVGCKMGWLQWSMSTGAVVLQPKTNFHISHFSCMTVFPIEFSIKNVLFMILLIKPLKYKNNLVAVGWYWIFSSKMTKYVGQYPLCTVLMKRGLRCRVVV